MARFEFRLEALLKLRKMRQEQAERELAQRLSQLRVHERRTAELEGQIADFYGEIRGHQGTGEIRISGLIADRRYLNQLHQLRLHEQAAAARGRQLADQARRQLADRKQQTDIMKKLKERMRQRFQKEVLRREMIALDDLANAKTAWRMQQEAGHE